MPLAIRTIGYHLVAQLRLPEMLHRLFYQDRLTIITYHAVVRSPLKVYSWCFLDESLFHSQVKYLKEHFDVIPLSKAVERMRKGEIYCPTAVITFDDGFQNNYDVAFPILYEAGLPATIFLTTGLVNTSDTLWYCRLNRALAHTSKSSLEWGGCEFDLSGPRSKAETAVAIQAKLKQFAHPQLLAELRRIILELGDDPDCPINPGSPYRMLSHEAIADMAASGLIEFGAHTHTHAILSRLGPRERQEEIERSITAVKELTGRPCHLFAYPNGGAQDYDAETITTLKAYGVHASVTAIAEPNDSLTPTMELRRYGVGADIKMTSFQLKVHHFTAQVRRMRQ
jgi:peptidoglycan/xylan/chitin deacetylase (PgdA/CDA1 family)